MARLIVVRHGATAWSADKRLQGRRDLPLSPDGLAEVRRWRLDRAITGEADWVASPLARALQTARCLGGRPMPDAVWIEQDYGAWEGHRLADLRRADPAGMAAIEAAGLDYQPPGGESPRRVMTRLAPWLAERAAAPDAARPCIVITHKGVQRALLALATGWAMTGPPPVKLRDGHAHLFDLDAAGAPRLTRANVSLLPDALAAP